MMRDAGELSVALGHPTEQGHDEVVRLAARVDGTAHLGDAERDAVVGADRKREAELVAVERTLGLADHDSVEAAMRIAERSQQPARFGRRFHGSDRLWPMSKNSSTIVPALSINVRLRSSCHVFDAAVSCWSSVLTRP
jgi:hypothetical protein